MARGRRAVLGLISMIAVFAGALDGLLGGEIETDAYRAWMNVNELADGWCWWIGKLMSGRFMPRSQLRLLGYRDVRCSPVILASRIKRPILWNSFPKITIAVDLRI